MAIKYVDKTGLETFWSQVKAKIVAAEQAAVAEAQNKDNVLLGYINTLQGYFVDGKAGDAIKAEKDADGNTISATYLKIANVDTVIKKGQANGVATLDATGKVPAIQLPSYVDDILEGYYISSTEFRADKSTTASSYAGESGIIYVDKETNKTYRWSGSAYVEISASLALGKTASTAYPGDAGALLEEAVEDIELNYLKKTDQATAERLGAVILGTSTDILDGVDGPYVPTCSAVLDFFNTMSEQVFGSVPTEALTTQEIEAICAK